MRKQAGGKRIVAVITAMISMLALMATVGTSPASAQGGEQENIYAFWDFAGQRAWNLDAKFNIRTESDTKFYSQIFDFDTGGGGYMGLQRTRNGAKIAIFSLWRDGTQGSAANIQADFGNCVTHNEMGGGIKCTVGYQWNLKEAYRIRIWRMQDLGDADRFGAWVIDKRGNETKIGEIRLSRPANNRAELISTATFIEDFDDQGDCVSPIPTTLRVSRPTINNGQRSLAFAGDNGGSNCANGEVKQRGTRQSWNMSVGTEPVMFQSVGANCVEVPRNSRKNGKNLWMHDCDGDGRQQWVLTTSNQIKLAGTNKCMDVEGPSSANGTPVQIWDCKSGLSNQRWVLAPDGSIRGYAGKCLDVRYAGTSNKTKVQIWSCNGSPAQTWARLTP
ncbi:MAG: ricin-type beta-trefoil lectin domain protein [Actinomycetota bacterium]